MGKMTRINRKTFDAFLREQVQRMSLLPELP
ncbi:MAG: hypothetical protein K6G43_10055 [Lachnospiraceae bacterium]|nr:hypothetical protein [Lachnospiraceae bacterium]